MIDEPSELGGGERRWDGRHARESWYTRLSMSSRREGALGYLLGFAAFLTLMLAARVSGAAPVSVWYRTTDGCPNAEVFLGRLSAQGVEARIARVGDHIDFVVTLGQEGGQSLATLERQSTERTVAIREVRAATCEAAANALALTLALTVDPEATPGAANTAPLPAAASSPVAPAAPENQPSAAASTASSNHADTGASSPSAAAAPRSQRFTFGVQGSVGTLVGGAPLWGANAFAALDSTRGLRPSGRVSFVTGVERGPVDDVTLSLYAGRLEGCPATLGGALSVTACAALDLGALSASSSASGGSSDTSFWGALWGLTRLRYAAAEQAFTAEIQGGVTTALTRYRVTSGIPPETLAEVRPWGVGLAAGAGVRWP